MTGLPMGWLLTGGAALLVVNAVVYVVCMHGVSHGCRSARDFCVLSFGFCAAAVVALFDIAFRVSVDPLPDIVMVVFKTSCVGVAVSSVAAVGFCLARR